MKDIGINKGLIISLLFIILIFSSCASKRSVSSDYTSKVSPIRKYSVSELQIEPPEEPRGIYYTIQRGDTLSSIADRFEISVYSLRNINKIKDSNKIKVGQRLFIPNGASKKFFYTDDVDITFVWPIIGDIIKSDIKNDYSKPNGIDIKVISFGKILSSANGRVVFCGDMRGYGKTIIISHQRSFSTVYSNVDEFLVEPGDYVDQGTYIASIGNGADNYLHFEIRKNAEAIDPYRYLSVD